VHVTVVIPVWKVDVFQLCQDLGFVTFCFSWYVLSLGEIFLVL